jgi:hypothetical protein
MRMDGCSWDGYTCNAAADNGHLDCLRHMRIDVPGMKTFVLLRFKRREKI